MTSVGVMWVNASTQPLTLVSRLRGYVSGRRRLHSSPLRVCKCMAVQEGVETMTGYGWHRTINAYLVSAVVWVLRKRLCVWVATAVRHKSAIVPPAGYSCRLTPTAHASEPGGSIGRGIMSERRPVLVIPLQGSHRRGRLAGRRWPRRPVRPRRIWLVWRCTRCPVAERRWRKTGGHLWMWLHWTDGCATRVRCLLSCLVNQFTLLHPHVRQLLLLVRKERLYQVWCHAVLLYKYST